MRIEQITRYAVAGKEFDSVHKAEAHLVDLIGETLDAAFNAANLGPGQKIKIVDSLWANRAKLAPLLGCEGPSDGC